MPGWVHIYNAGIDRLNALLLKLQALGDVDPSYLEEHCILTWKPSTGKWVPRRFKD